ncbi:hypothetical protein AMK59_2291, partial [Oryctes borbonicus]
MNVQEAAGNEQTGTDGMYCRFRVSDVKMSASVPVVNIDSENYMLRGISPVPEQRSRSSYSQTAFNLAKTQPLDMDLNMNMDMFVLRESGSSLATSTTATATASATTANANASSNSNTATDEVLSTAGSCARILSFHSMICTCCVSCCCMCGSLCSPDCYACFHTLCTRFAANYSCQNDTNSTNVTPPVTLDSEKEISTKYRGTLTRNHSNEENVLIHQVF